MTGASQSIGGSSATSAGSWTRSPAATPSFASRDLLKSGLDEAPLARPRRRSSRHQAAEPSAAPDEGTGAAVYPTQRLADRARVLPGVRVQRVARRSAESHGDRRGEAGRPSMQNG